MSSMEGHQPWTLCGLIGAFIDLALAYFLLCTSTFAFFASKLFGFVGLRLPCPCQGVFGFRSAEFCWHILLIEWPVKTIHGVHILVNSRFPFDSVWLENRAVEVDGGEACCSSISGSGNQILVDRESGSDVKGKRLVNLKQRPGIRRRRRASLAGKFTTGFPSEGFSSVARVFRSSWDGRESGERFCESLGRRGGKDDDARDDLITPSGNCKDEETYISLESSGPFAESNDTANHSVHFEKDTNDIDKKKSAVIFESEKVRMLERALAEERAACASLCLELDKERAAAATAADEAMAMISRLQKDKASMEIETRQYERMIEEKFAYDEDEIDILKEILVRRERENHFLEKEIETYRRMSITGDEQSNDDISDTLDDWGRRPLSSPYSSADPHFTHYNTMSPKNNVQSNTYFPSEVPFVEKQGQPDGHELIEETVILVDHVDIPKLCSVPEDMDSYHYSDEN